MARPVQCMAALGGSPVSVRPSTACTSSCSVADLPGGRVLSPSKPSSPPRRSAVATPEPLGAADTSLMGHLQHGQALVRQQHDPGTQDVGERPPAVVDDPAQASRVCAVSTSDTVWDMSPRLAHPGPLRIIRLVQGTKQINEGG